MTSFILCARATSSVDPWFLRAPKFSSEEFGIFKRTKPVIYDHQVTEPLTRSHPPKRRPAVTSRAAAAA